jgi:hypothetical protein
VAPAEIKTLTRATVPDDWSELDSRAVDTVRVLAADAVQKVGNGHPGTAMSLAPLAYTQFQRVLRHDPADPDWIGRDRFVLSCGHSNLTLYIQLYLSGYGLRLEDLEALRPWGSKTPGHPEYRRTQGVEITTGPLGQGNGIALHGPTRPYGGTFLVFSDYLRPAVRLAALMRSPLIYVWTHDSIGLGEDGPTHQPVEHLAALRAIPGLTVIRPGDANETAYAWRAALERPNGPKGLALTRQDPPVLEGTCAEGVARGGYVLAEASRVRHHRRGGRLRRTPFPGAGRLTPGECWTKHHTKESCYDRRPPRCSGSALAAAGVSICSTTRRPSDCSLATPREPIAHKHACCARRTMGCRQRLGRPCAGGVRRARLGGRRPDGRLRRAGERRHREVREVVDRAAGNGAGELRSQDEISHGRVGADGRQHGAPVAPRRT